MSIVSNNLKYLRRLNGLTQEQFARRIGIKRSLLGAYEEARANPNLDNLKVIANTFGVSVDHLIKQDIRKIRDTSDLTFGFESKPTPVVSQTLPSNANLFSTNPKPLGEMMNNFLQQPPSPPTSYRNTGIKLVSQRISFKPVQQRTIHSHPLNQYEAKTFNSAYDREMPRTFDTRSTDTKQIIQWVRWTQFNEYLQRYQDNYFIRSLPEFQIPTLPTGEYRAFEAGKDFAFEGALLIGSFVRNWFDISDGKNYVLITKSQGIIHRKVYNHVKSKGNLLLIGELPSINPIEVSIKDVLEAWEIRAFVSQKLPDTSLSFEKLSTLVEEIKFEIEKLKS